MAIDGVGGGSAPPPPPAPSRAPDDAGGGGPAEDPFAGEAVDDGGAGEMAGDAPAPGGDTVDIASLTGEGGDFGAPQDGLEGDGEPASFNADGSVDEGGDMGGALDELI